MDTQKSVVRVYSEHSDRQYATLAISPETTSEEMKEATAKKLGLAPTEDLEHYAIYEVKK